MKKDIVGLVKSMEYLITLLENGLNGMKKWVNNHPFFLFTKLDEINISIKILNTTRTTTFTIIN